MDTTAEGVETQDELELIRELGCSHIQGYVYGKPARADEALQQLGRGGGDGHRERLSRSAAARARRCCAPRGSLRATSQGEIRIRNMSATGAMIDGITSTTTDGVDILIELIEDQMFPASVRWARGGKAGLEFNEHFNLERLNQGYASRIRRTG